MSLGHNSQAKCNKQLGEIFRPKFLGSSPLSHFNLVQEKLEADRFLTARRRFRVSRLKDWHERPAMFAIGLSKWLVTGFYKSGTNSTSSKHCRQINLGCE
jgi:hypothetical protein